MSDTPNPAAGQNSTAKPAPTAPGAAVASPTVPAPTTPVEGAPAPTRAQRRAAAVAKAIAGEDAAKPAAVPAAGVAELAGIGTSPSAEEKAPEPKAEQPLSPQMAQLARRDAEVRAGEQRLKAERETFRREQHAAQQAHLSHEQVGQLIRTNPVQLAEQHKLTPAERRAAAEQLYWASYSDEERGKLPQDYQERMRQLAAQARPLTETEALKARLEKQEAEFKAYQESVTTRERQVEETRVQTSFLDHTVTELTSAAERFPHVAAMLETDPDGTRGVLWRFALKAAKANPEGDVTTDLVAGEYEAFLAERLRPLAKVYGPKATATTSPTTSPKAVGGLSEAAVAAPTPVRVEPTTRAERRASALAKIQRLG